MIVQVTIVSNFFSGLWIPLLLLMQQQNERQQNENDNDDALESYQENKENENECRIYDSNEDTFYT